jgi:hypothetical protein
MPIWPCEWTRIRCRLPLGRAGQSWTRVDGVAWEIVDQIGFEDHSLSANFDGELPKALLKDLGDAF